MEPPAAQRRLAGRPDESGPSARSSSRRTTIAFLAGTLAYQAGRLGLSLIAARSLGPEAFGDWVLVTLLIVYLSSLGLGITNGAGNQIPFRTGAGDLSSAQRIAEVATGAALLAGIVAGAAAAAIATVVLPNPVPATLVLVGLAAALQHLFLLQQVLFRSWFAFGRAAVQLGALGVVVFVGGVTLLPFGLDGLLAAQIVTFISALTAGWLLLPHRPRPRIDRVMVNRMVGVGFPIMLAGLTYGLLTTLDRWLVASFLTRVDVGFYGLVGIALSGLLLLPQLIAQQFYPRMSFARGAGADHHVLLSMAHRQGLVAGALVAVAASATVMAGWLLVPLLLPEYQASLPPLSIASVGVVAYAFASGYGNLMLAVEMSRTFLLIQVIAACLNLVLGVGLLSAGMGLWAVAVASAAGMVAYSMMLYRAASAVAARW
jgi:O-antigen/teichoic acid export membrane protein